MSVIEKWLNDSSVERFKDSSGNLYGIRVLGGGGNLFFQENEKALICEIDAINSVIYTSSVKCWSGYEKMSNSEKKRVLALIDCYYQQVYSKKIHTEPK